MAPAQAKWIAVDWGTSHLRVWAMDADGRPVANGDSSRGMGSLRADEFETALLELIEPYLRSGVVMPVICCGMVGSRQGWAEAPYLSVPCAAPQGQTVTRVTAQDPRIAVFLLPGIKQVAPPDVMRGEETQIAGFLHFNPDFDGVVCLPGTHTKWVHLSAGEVVSFQTFMTGELFALLSGQSVLRHSVSTTGFCEASFSEAIADSLSGPQQLAARLFGVRAGTLVSGLDPDAARARLSGLLIGAELAAARPYWLGRDVAIIGDSTLSERYRSGLEAQGVAATLVDVTRMTLSGLAATYKSLKETIT